MAPKFEYSNEDPLDQSPGGLRNAEDFDLLHSRRATRAEDRDRLADRFERMDVWDRTPSRRPGTERAVPRDYNVREEAPQIRRVPVADRNNRGPPRQAPRDKIPVTTRPPAPRAAEPKPAFKRPIYPPYEAKYRVPDAAPFEPASDNPRREPRERPAFRHASHKAREAEPQWAEPKRAPRPRTPPKREGRPMEDRRREERPREKRPKEESPRDDRPRAEPKPEGRDARPGVEPAPAAAAERDPEIAVITATEFMHKSVYLKTIGEGGEGKAQLWEWNPHRKNKKNRLYAVIKVVKSKKNSYGKTPAEVKALERIAKFKHRAIITYFGWSPDCPVSGCNSIVLEYMDMGDLYRMKYKAVEKEVAVPEYYIWNIFRQVAAALAFLHVGHSTEYHNTPEWRPMVHHDLKPENILVRYRSNNRLPLVKLTDFGMAEPRNSLLDGDKSMHGTPHYQPPENVYTAAADVWGLGAVIHWLCLGEGPVDGRGKEEAILADKNKDLEWRLPRRVLRIDHAPHVRGTQYPRGTADQPWEEMTKRITAYDCLVTVEGNFRYYYNLANLDTKNFEKIIRGSKVFDVMRANPNSEEVTTNVMWTITQR
ncbi:kinase-like protein [Trichodelitschia bisporula]|uniref:non-specific serine/threonine protein kinase n=1 Tax=Trichodelitschia bisporula TaxID=703511 RepID=A0A6G1HV20_9PEZI|nr:kinase-like protein [Trichodelitschia bisporula]